MKKLVFLIVTMVFFTSCVGVKNSINRSSVKDGELFIKYGVPGYPDGVMITKGSECLLTERERIRLERQWLRRDKKEDEISPQNKLYRNIKTQLALHPEQRENVKEFTKRISYEYDKLIEFSPTISDKVIQKYAELKKEKEAEIINVN
mgnify:CR=1 FL=1